MCKSGLNNNLIKKSYSVITNKYSTAEGKKFVLHIISSFIPIEEKASTIVMSDTDEIEDIKCCISKCDIIPSDMQIDTSPRKVIVNHKLTLIPRQICFGYKSEFSNKVISEEAIEALKRFIDHRASVGDDVITKIKNYIDKNDPRRIPTGL